MPQMKRKESHADTSGPPAGSMSAVHSVRDESACPSSRIRRDEGRFKRPDCPYLKRGRNALKIGTWNVRTLNQLGKLENLRQEVESLDLDVLGLSETRLTLRRAQYPLTDTLLFTPEGRNTNMV